MTQLSSTSLHSCLTRVVPRDDLEAKERRLCVVRCQRKVDVFVLVWALVIGFESDNRRTLQALRKTNENAASHTVARSGFH